MLLGMKIVALASEMSVLGHMDHDEEIAGGATADSRLAGSRNP